MQRRRKGSLTSSVLMSHSLIAHALMHRLPLCMHAAVQHNYVTGSLFLFFAHSLPSDKVSRITLPSCIAQTSVLLPFYLTQHSWCDIQSHQDCLSWNVLSLRIWLLIRYVCFLCLWADLCRSNAHESYKLNNILFVLHWGILHLTRVLLKPCSFLPAQHIAFQCMCI